MPSCHLVIFFISFVCILLELFFTRILNFKAWNHIVYIIIPFAILGYGIGANFLLIFKEKIFRLKERMVVAVSLLALSAIILISTLLLIRFPLRVEYLVNLFANLSAISRQLQAYTLVMLPFVIIGFLVTYFFSLKPSESNKLYFFDLVGAGLGAAAFFFLINWLEVFRSLFLLSSLTLALSILFFICKNHRQIILGLLAIFVVCGALLPRLVPEIKEYAIDPAKGWEWIPGYYPKEDYDTLFSEWHPLGRTDIYRIKNPQIRQAIFDSSAGTFEINLDPPPEFSYFATNFLAGTPIYNMAPDGLQKYNSQVKLFSQGMEVPYTILREPKVVVIGTGGGRDIFMAKTHGAAGIVGAEINPAIFEQMSKGGRLHEYSGQIYTADNVKVFNIDGRHLVKTLQPNSYDLIILNGVDTFSGLSTGAYAYAESYLYTKNAVIDYLKLLSDDGMINFNRWLFADYPRETLKLHAICLQALREAGAQEPWKHIIIGGHKRWSINLIKKTPFTAEEKQAVKEYFKTHETELIFPTENWENNAAVETTNYYDQYAQAFIDGKENVFAHFYPFDISVITDDDPFFYKYYKLNFFNPFAVAVVHHTGTVIFMSQMLVLLQAVLFIIIFIFLPLLFFKKSGIKTLPPSLLKPFIIYFSCLGLGFMFIEIPMMQRFGLLLGSPIYSLSITLAALLVFSGMKLGSALLAAKI